MHIAKTAGTTLQNLLKRAFSASEVFGSDTPQTVDLGAVPRKKLVRSKLVSGHFGEWHLRRRFASRTSLTVLREPFARFASFANHAAMAPAILNDVPEEVEFLELLMNGDTKAAIAQASSWYARSSQVSWLGHRRLGQGEELSLIRDEALQTLDYYDLVVTEDSFDEFYIELASALNQLDSIVPRHNSAAHYQLNFTDADAQTFRDYFPEEYTIYAYATQLNARTLSRLRKMSQTGELFQTVAEMSDILDWDEPVRCTGFSDRVLAGSPVSYKDRMARWVTASYAATAITITQARPAFFEMAVWTARPELLADVVVRIGEAHYALDNRELIMRQNEDPCFAQIRIDLEGAEVAIGTQLVELICGFQPRDQEIWILEMAFVGSEQRS